MRPGADGSSKESRRSLRSRMPALRANWWADLWPWVGLAVGIGSAVLLGLATTPGHPLFKVHTAVFDFLMGQRPPQVLDGPESPIALVGIDESSFGRFGYPIPRRDLAEGLERILAADPKAVVIDVQFTSVDAPAEEVRKALESVAPMLPSSSRAKLTAIAGEHDTTRLLLDVIEDPRVIGTFFAHGLDDGTSDVVMPAEVEDMIDDVGCESFRGASGVVLDQPDFLEAYVNHGNARLEPEWDGLIRRYPLFVRVGDSLYPSLAVAAATIRTETQIANVECTDGDIDSFSIGADYPLPFGRTSDYPDARVFISYGGTFSESFRNWTPFERLFAPLTILPEERTAAEATLSEDLKKRFAGKLVFLGLRNDFEDKYPTYNDPSFAGVAIHATVAYGLVTKHWLHRSTNAIIGEAVACVVFGLVVTLIFLRWGSSWLILLAPASPAFGYFASLQLLSRGLLVDLIVPGFVGSVAVLLCGALRFIVEQQRAEKERLRAESEAVRAEQEQLRAEQEKIRAERLGAFLSPEVAKIAGENPDLLKPQRQEISILFSDIRSFTTVAEGMPPETLAEMLSEYLTWMTEIVLSNHGTLDKYIGDAVMAIFGAPLPEKAHARWACTTALEMIDALDGLNERWRAQGRTTLQFGIGINTGSVVVGTMGSKNKPEYTCIGDDVNFASRAEGLTKAYGATIVVGESTMKLAGDDFLFRDLGPVKVKGKTRGVKIYELLGTRAQVADPAWVDVFHQGLNAFLLRDWNKAEELFERVKTMRGGTDGPSKAFLVWTKSFKATPPDDAWDGTLDRAEK